MNDMTLQIRSPDKLRLQLGASSGKQSLVIGSGGGGTRDYEKLYNKPSINGLELSGDVELVRQDTTENWNAQRSYIPLRGQVIIYTDHGQMDDGYGEMINVPGIKIGDGNAYLIDLPFVGADVRYQILTELRAHTQNTSIHVSAADRQRWDDKLNYTINDGNLIFNRE